MLETKGVEIKISSLAEETLLDKVSRWLAMSKPLNRVRMQRTRHKYFACPAKQSVFKVKILKKNFLKKPPIFNLSPPLAPMARIRQMIAVDGRKCWTLFHPCTRNTYVIPSVAEILKTVSTSRPIRTALGGTMKESNRVAVLEGEIQHYPFSTHAFVVEEIGTDEDGNRIEVLFGALAMKEWGIRLNPAEEKLDLSHYPKEFVEF